MRQDLERGGVKYTPLTKKEMECVRWLIKGKTAVEIGMILGISENTVVTHVEHIKTKLHCYKQFQLGYVLGKYAEELMCEEEWC